MTLPEADPAVVRIFSDYLFWFLVLDDSYCENLAGRSTIELAQLFSCLIRVAERPDSPILADHPLANGLRDLVTRIAGRASDHLSLTFVEAMRGFFLALIWEASFRDMRRQATLEEYVLLRIHNGMMRPYSLLLDLGGKGEMSARERDSQAIRALIEMAVLILLLDNDILSYGKESGQREEGRSYNQNPISILQQQDGMNFREAVYETIAIRNQVMLRYIQLRDHVLDCARKPVTSFLARLDTMTRACFDWSIPTDRYRVKDSAVIPSATAVPPAGDVAPLPFAAIRWWWSPDLDFYRLSTTY
jgi:hypothetical protein